MQDLVTHFINLVEDDATKALVGVTVRKIVGVLSRRFEARRKQAEASDDPRRLELEIERLNETMSSIVAELGQLKASQINWRAVEAEASEPAFEEFVDEAFAASAGSRTASKRMTLGRLIAHRLLVQSDTADEALLRRALRLVRDLTEPQLLLLAALAFVHSFRGADSGIRFASRDQAEEWLRKHLAHKARALRDGSWTYDDLETLDSVGTVRIPPDTGGTIHSASAGLDQWLMVHGIGPMDGVEGDVGTRASHELFERRFPTITMMRRLAFGNGLSDSPNRSSPILELTALTPLGATIGSLVLEQLAGLAPSGD